MTTPETAAKAAQGQAVRMNGKQPAALHDATESMSLLALRLRADLQPQTQGRSLLVTAAADDEAGLELTLELAWCLAEELGHRVLLVDGAFGDRRLSQSLGLGQAAGLAECIDAPADTESRLPELTQATRHPRIAVLPQGNPAGAITVREQSIQQLLALGCQRHDFVLVCSSLRADVSRSLTFCSGVDAALLLALEEETTWDQIARAQSLLDDCGARRVALVLAQAPSPRPRQRG
jgi:Mrp family chromosome partitioning ATPase